MVAVTAHDVRQRVNGVELGGGLHTLLRKGVSRSQQAMQESSLVDAGLVEGLGKTGWDGMR